MPLDAGPRYVKLDDTKADWEAFLAILYKAKYLDSNELKAKMAESGQDSAVVEFGQVFRIAIKHNFKEIQGDCHYMLYSIIAHCPAQWGRMESLKPMQIFQFLQIAFESNLEYYQITLQFGLGTMLELKESRTIILNSCGEGMGAGHPGILDELYQEMTNVLWNVSDFSEVLEKEGEIGCCTRVWGKSAQVCREIIKDESMGGLIEYLGELAYYAKEEEFGFCSKRRWEISQTISVLA
ncbi:hypothetical protein M422DRAFT_268266 [Sphaerobolus stellatus SS14]|uniref:Uncharacterized protein n=1 Tax=Sphaerobolus stellatus (strain SS14) TaxID=990650 RepID=A0A0C9TKD4_SPHS4|nr:hypothetical protein M422DRAFT_268266 [Sphaerobolus stellatus SS14]